ncbi:MAG: hypothetical protein K0M50_12200 [Prolixibacteraceae bacterium]|nr:hypothetical protein [Prolixibacteraceae bacterium]
MTPRHRSLTKLSPDNLILVNSIPFPAIILEISAGWLVIAGTFFCRLITP